MISILIYFITTITINYFQTPISMIFETHELAKPIFKYAKFNSISNSHNNNENIFSLQNKYLTHQQFEFFKTFSE